MQILFLVQIEYLVYWIRHILFELLLKNIVFLVVFRVRVKKKFCWSALTKSHINSLCSEYVNT